MQQLSPDQIVIQIVQWLLGTGGPLAAWLINAGIGASTVNSIETIVLAVVPPVIALILGIANNTNASNVRKAAKVVGVSVFLNKNASASVRKMAMNHPEIKEAA